MSGTTTGPSSAKTISKMEFLRGNSRTASPQCDLIQMRLSSAKPSSGRIGPEVLGGQPGNGVVAGLRRGVENPGRIQRSQPGSLLLPIDSAGLQLCLWHLDSSPSGIFTAASPAVTTQPPRTAGTCSQAPKAASPAHCRRLPRSWPRDMPHSVTCCYRPASPLSEGITKGMRLRRG